MSGTRRIVSIGNPEDTGFTGHAGPDAALNPGRYGTGVTGCQDSAALGNA